MYALNLAEDGRILSATYPQYATPNMALVETLPDGDICDFRYIAGKYVYEPLPKPEEPAAEEDATTDEVLNALLGVI